MTPYFKNNSEDKNKEETTENKNKQNELEHNEIHLFKVENYKCNHGCNHSFKTKKQMILHHDKIDNFCFNEKKLLIKLIESYQNSVDKILSEQNYNNFKNTDEYQYLQQQLKKAKDCSIDKIQLESLIEEEDLKNKDKDNNENNNSV